MSGGRVKSYHFSLLIFLKRSSALYPLFLYIVYVLTFYQYYGNSVLTSLSAFKPWLPSSPVPSPPHNDKTSVHVSPLKSLQWFSILSITNKQNPDSLGWYTGLLCSGSFLLSSSCLPQVLWIYACVCLSLPSSSSRKLLLVFKDLTGII